MFLTQTPQNQRSLSELVRGKQFAETMRIGIVLCRELRRGAHYACATIRMASTNKVCALLLKSEQSAWDILSINRVFSPEISVCYIEAIIKFLFLPLSRGREYRLLERRGGLGESTLEVWAEDKLVYTMPYEEEEDRDCEVKCPKGGGGCGIFGATAIWLSIVISTLILGKPIQYLCQKVAHRNTQCFCPSV